MKTKILCSAGTLLILCLLGACSPSDHTPPQPKLFEQERNALDKSKTLDAAQQQQTQEQKQSIEKQTQ